MPSALSHLTHTIKALILVGCALVFLQGLCVQQVLASDFHRQFDESQIATVLLGEQTHYALHIESKTPLTMGVTWIFVSEGQGKLTFNAAYKLANSLTEKGWKVVVVAPTWLSSTPEPTAVPADGEPIQETEEKTVQAWQSSLSNTVGFDAASNQLRLLLQVLQQQSADVAGFRMFVAEGMPAALLLALGENSSVSQPDALTVISPFWPDVAVNKMLPDYSATYPAPILDINYVSSNSWNQAIQQQRLIQATVQIKMHYRQRKLPRHVGQYAVNWMSGEIVGWTRSLGW